MPRTLTKFSLRGLLALASCPILISFYASPVSAETLKGNVTKQGEKERTGLSRSDLTQPQPTSDDPFSDDKAEISAPDSNFRMDEVRKPKPPFDLRAMQENQRPVQAMQPMTPKGNPFEGENDPMPEMQQPPQPFVNKARGNDPDSSPEMQLAWDQWHHRVAEAIYQRFNFLAKLGFKHSPPLLCQVAYVVSRDGHIQNVQVQQKSTNALFNIIVYQTVKSLDGDINLLQYPPGSRRQFVPKVGTFTQNYGGDGFKYTVGDRETVQGR